MAYYLGIDLGTSGTKTLVMTAAGKVLATGVGGHTVSSPKPGYSEQDPKQWWRATVKATRMAIAAAGIDGKQVAGIGFSGQMHGLVCLDAAGGECCGRASSGTTSERPSSAASSPKPPAARPS